MAGLTALPYRIRYANGKDTCTKCGTQIPKGLQLAIIEQSLTDDCLEPKWYDQDCFFKHRRPASETLIDGFANLRITHQLEIRKLLGFGKSDSTDSINSDQPPEKKICSADAKTNPNLEDEIKKQMNELYDIRSKLKRNTKREDRIAMLTFNKQFVPEGNSEILYHLADVLYFGAMSPCPACKEGQFVFKNSIYTCNGNISEWSKCINTVKAPHRVPAKIPEKYKIFLRGNFKVRTRILNDVPRINDDDFELCVKQPLFGMELMIVGETEKAKSEIERKINQMGGTIVEKIHENVAAIISNSGEVTKMEPIMEVAKAYGIHIVPEAFVDNIKNFDLMELMAMCDLGNWGQDPRKRLPQLTIDDAKSLDSPSTSTGTSTPTTPKVQGMKWKYGSVVDPDSQLENIAHVYTLGSLKYYAILDLVDIAANKNSYFKMQLLESDKEQKYWLFESKGRIATEIGSFNLKPMANLIEAIATFKSVYHEKTGNDFGTKKFVKQPGKYNEMPIDHEITDKKVLTQYKTIEYSMSSTTLSEPVYKLMQLLFDVLELESTMISFDLDVNKMPLGKISGQQIEDALKVLRNIEKLLRKKDSCSKEIADESNKFYSLIPHNFGTNRPSWLNTQEIVDKKYEMLSDMKQMEITYNILQENPDDRQNTVDIHYRRLNGVVEITDLDKGCDEYKEIERYVTNTTLPDFYGGRVQLIDVFKISRRDEIERFARYEGTPNRKLLFHGTRITNIVGIMTNGLKIPEHGLGRFGRGIYFSDAISKSAGYCNVSGDIGLMLLCEVALGQCEIIDLRNGRLGRDFNNPDGRDSVQGLGAYSSRSMDVRPDGLMVPNGVLERRANEEIAFPTAFNEYTVRDESRVKIRYLLKLKFEHPPPGIGGRLVVPNFLNPGMALNLAPIAPIALANFRLLQNAPNNPPPG